MVFMRECHAGRPAGISARLGLVRLGSRTLLIFLLYAWNTFSMAVENDSGVAESVNPLRAHFLMAADTKMLIQMLGKSLPLRCGVYCDAPDLEPDDLLVVVSCSLVSSSRGLHAPVPAHRCVHIIPVLLLPPP
eukprot:1157421-Pelagomonas_calceolata.AAC.1